MTSACCTLFFGAYRVNAEELVAQYEATADPANGYLIQMNHECILVDAVATELADWSRQTEIAAALTDEDTFALSVFLVGGLWALALARDGRQGPIAAFTPDNAKNIEQVPNQLLELERQFDDLFPETDLDEVDRVFGAMIEGAVSPEEGLVELLGLLGCSPEWLRWSWYETIPEQLFLDPDLASRVTPLGEARALWEE